MSRSTPRVALVAASREIVGGHYVQVEALERALVADGHAVTFVPINPPPPAALAWVRRIPGVRTAVTQALYWPSLGQLRQVDVVHVFAASYWSFLLSPVPAIVIAERLGKPVVLHYHSGEADDHLEHWGMAVHPWLRRVNEIVVPSRYLEAVFLRHGYRVRVIPNIVDLDRFVYRERSTLAPKLLSNRNLEPHYRVDVTLRAFARLRTRYPEATLTVAGSGSQEGELRALAGALGAGGITFVGSVSPSGMPALMAGADIFVNASAVDNQPVSILEAFASGLPVVSTAVGDVPGMLAHGAYGYLVPRDESDALCATIAAVLESPGEALARAREAHAQVQRYTWPAAGPEWRALYQSLAAPRPAWRVA
jgi:glycosyltransferase involved in cell wall biosynthesis